MVAKANNPDKRVLNYVKLYTWRLQGTSESDIAAYLGFDSPEALYRHLNQDGFPVCPICGKTPVVGPHCGKSPSKNQRKVRTSGEAIELPPAKTAKPLFCKALDSLRELVETLPKPLPDPPNFMEEEFTAEEGVDTLQEYSQGKLYVSALVNEPGQNQAGGTYYRKDYSAEEWEELCEFFEASPTDEIVLANGFGISPAGGVKRYPADMLVNLIGMYVLAGEPLEPLVELLHPEPETVDMKEIEKQIYGYVTPKRRMDGM